MLFAAYAEVVPAPEAPLVADNDELCERPVMVDMTKDPEPDADDGGVTSSSVCLIKPVDVGPLASWLLLARMNREDMAKERPV